MSDKTNERLEHEARESLVAADLSAKMKQWRDQPSPPSGGGGSGLRLLILLLALGGAAWWLWPKPDQRSPALPAPPVEHPAPLPQQSTPALLEPQKPEPMAQKSAGNRYLAMAQSNYQAPNFASDIRGDAATGQDALNDARQALADRRPADALNALQNTPAQYQTDADYLRAHTLFQLRKYKQSAEAFGRLTNSVRYGEAAQWYEILALLPGLEGDKAAVLNRLKKIGDDDGHTFQREAKALVGAL